MIAGITGPRTGASQRALLSVAQTLCAYNVRVLHDGDCIGVDAEVYYLARAFGIHVELHPPTNPKYRAYCARLGDVVHPEKGYHDRDMDTVNAAEFMIGVPNVVSVHIKPTGGTGWTIDYARSVLKPLVLIWPDGSATYERWDKINA